MLPPSLLSLRLPSFLTTFIVGNCMHVRNSTTSPVRGWLLILQLNCTSLSKAPYSILDSSFWVSYWYPKLHKAGADPAGCLPSSHLPFFLDNRTPPTQGWLMIWKPFCFASGWSRVYIRYSFGQRNIGRKLLIASHRTVLCLGDQKKTQNIEMQ